MKHKYLIKKLCIPAIALSSLLLCQGMLCFAVEITTEKEENITESTSETASEKADILPGGTFSSFTSWDLDGNVIDQSIFEKADLTMLNVWGTFCGPCLREMPYLGELFTEYADKGLQIIGIVVDIPTAADGTPDEGMLTTAKELIEETGAAYLHILPSEDLVKAKLGTVYAVPTTYFVNSQGQIQGDEIIGSMEKDGWIKTIDHLLDVVKS